MSGETHTKVKAAGLKQILKAKSSRRDRLGRLLLKIQKALLWPVLVPIAAVLAARGRGIFVISNPHRIGHLVAEPDWLLKRVALGELPDKRYTILVAPEDRVANDAVVDLWRHHFDVVSDGPKFGLFKLLSAYRGFRVYGGDGLEGRDGPADYARLLATWGHRPPVVSLPAPHVTVGEDVLRKLGVPDGAWFVCLHVREAGYSPSDEFIHSYRNADIATYAAAVREIAARGGWVIRMGDPTMTPLQEDGEDRETWPNTVDYALSDHRSPAADIFLCARCTFLLGTTSGLSMVSTVFGVPCAYANLIPHGAGLGPSPHDISIMKKLEKSDGNLLSFREIFSSDISRFRASGLYEAANLHVVNNTADEIRDLTLEMLGRVGRAEDPPVDGDAERQARFAALIRPDDYCYGSTATVAGSFLQQNEDLL